jgi:farnesyl diphosphate synthase
MNMKMNWKTMMSNPLAFFAPYQARFEQKLSQLLQQKKYFSEYLHDPIAYSSLNGGKRLRPLLIYAAGAALDSDLQALDTPALAVELIHCYSLIHDDLPAMDNADLRRGKPSCHKAFNEASAILAGDAMQTLAFEVLVDNHAFSFTHKQRVTFVKILAKACGPCGMAEGQAMDLYFTNKEISLENLIQLHTFKTGKLISASIQLACITGSPSPQEQHALIEYANKIGLAFQVQDDILDETGNSTLTGKPTHQDVAKNKVTFPAVLGLEKAKAYAKDLCNEAIDLLSCFDHRAKGLRLIADYIYQRET